MAVQPKKKKTTSKPKATTPKKPVAKKKPVTKKVATKKRAPRKRKKKSHFKKNVFIVLGVFLMITFVFFGYYLGKSSDEKVSQIDRGEVESAYTTKQLLDDLSNIKVKKKEKQTKVHAKPKAKVTAKKVKPGPPKKVVVATVKKPIPVVKKDPIKKAVLVPHKQMPRLVIVIDDVSKVSQMDAIRATHLKLTPSIFPPSELSMTSHHLARGLKHFMIHLPMESGSKQFNSQYKTLMTRFTTEQIAQRAAELRQLFPQARYINNHTGSVFTGDYTAMYRLYDALRKEGFVFVDSRTIGSSKVRAIARKFGDTYVSRDIFIDNHHNVPYIHKQLSLAVALAKKKGYAIAIGHPHKVTMQALESAQDILKDVQLIYIDELYKER